MFGKVGLNRRGRIIDASRTNNPTYLSQLVRLLTNHLFAMRDSPSYFLVPVTSGLCAEAKPEGVRTARPEGTEAQRWYIEKGKDNTFAFRDGKSGKYLRADSGDRLTKTVVGERQLWKLTPSDTPNAYWFVLEFHSDEIVDE